MSSPSQSPGRTPNRDSSVPSRAEPRSFDFSALLSSETGLRERGAIEEIRSILAQIKTESSHAIDSNVAEKVEQAARLAKEIFPENWPLQLSISHARVIVHSRVLQTVWDTGAAGTGLESASVAFDNARLIHAQNYIEHGDRCREQRGFAEAASVYALAIAELQQLPNEKAGPLSNRTVVFAAWMYALSGDPDTVERYGAEALDRIEEMTPLERVQNQTFIEPLAWSLYMREHAAFAEQSMMLLEEASQIHPEMIPLSTRGRLWGEIGDFRRGQHRMAEALEAYDRSAKFLERDGRGAENDDEWQRVCFGRRQCFAAFQRYLSSESCLETEVLRYESGGRPPPVELLLSLAELYRSHARFRSSLLIFERALPKLDGRDPLLRAQTLVDAAAMATQCGQPTKSRKFLDQALLLAEEIPDRQEDLRKKGSLAYSLIDSLLSHDRWAEAHRIIDWIEGHFQDESGKLTPKLKRPIALQRARAYKGEGALADAIELLETAIAEGKGPEAGSPYDLLLFLGSIRNDLNQFDEARRLLLSAYLMLRERGQSSGLLKVQLYPLLAQVNEQLGRVDRAAKLTKRADLYRVLQEAHDYEPRVRAEDDSGESAI